MRFLSRRLVAVQTLCRKSSIGKSELYNCKNYLTMMSMNIIIPIVSKPHNMSLGMIHWVILEK